jgi:predicted DNA-binding transcriptional regulator YafY
MEYILIPSTSKNETTFLIDLFHKMHKQAVTFSEKEIEDFAFATALKEAEQTPKGSLSKVKAHIAKIVSK